jgi:hypothetical protein
MHLAARPKKELSLSDKQAESILISAALQGKAVNITINDLNDPDWIQAYRFIQKSREAGEKVSPEILKHRLKISPSKLAALSDPTAEEIEVCTRIVKERSVMRKLYTCMRNMFMGKGDINASLNKTQDLIREYRSIGMKDTLIRAGVVFADIDSCLSIQRYFVNCCWCNGFKPLSISAWLILQYYRLGQVFAAQHIQELLACRITTLSRHHDLLRGPQLKVQGTEVESACLWHICNCSTEGMHLPVGKLLQLFISCQSGQLQEIPGSHGVPGRNGHIADFLGSHIKLILIFSCEKEPTIFLIPKKSLHLFGLSDGLFQIIRIKRSPVELD